MVEKSQGQGVFIRLMSFRALTKANSAVVTAMEKCGCFEGMEKTAQIFALLKQPFAHR